MGFYDSISSTGNFSGDSRQNRPKFEIPTKASSAEMKGYAKLGSLMGDFPEVAIFRRFSALSAQNLLYMQAELRNLEVDLRSFADKDDVSTHPDRKVYSVDWFALKDSCEDGAEEGNDEKQWQTMREIRYKLEIYRKSFEIDIALD